MVTRFSLLIILCASFVSFAQSDDYIQPGLLEASSTISPSTMLARSDNNYYISGFAEYHFDKKISLRGDTYLFIDGEKDVPFINTAARTYFGVFYHWNKSNFDYSIGFQPGITYMKRNANSVTGDPLPSAEEAAQLMPSFAITTGVRYYVWKYFNFFANLSYVNSDLHGTRDGSFNTDELIFSAGLGFQISTIRK